MQEFWLGGGVKFYGYCHVCLCFFPLCFKNLLINLEDLLAGGGGGGGDFLGAFCMKHCIEFSSTFYFATEQLISISIADIRARVSTAPSCLGCDCGMKWCLAGLLRSRGRQLLGVGPREGLEARSSGARERVGAPKETSLRREGLRRGWSIRIQRPLLVWR